MDQTQLPECFLRDLISDVEASAKAKEVFARCVEQIERWPTPDTDNIVALRLTSIAAEGSRKPEAVKVHARRLAQDLLDAECAAAKWLKTEDLRYQLLGMAVTIYDHRRSKDGVLSANDVKAAWACLCRCSSQMETAELILGGDFKDCSDSEDSTYHPENDDMSLDAASVASASSSSSSESEGLIVLGPDSDSECDEQKERVVGMSVVEDRKDDAAENASLIANALLESVAPPEVFNKLQMTFRLMSLRGGCATANPFMGSDVDVLSHMVEFVHDEEFLYFASVCRGWKNAWGKRPTKTRALTTSTSVSQLACSFEGGLARTAVISICAISMGRLDLLRCAMANGCPWEGDLCRLAAEAGDLECLQWARRTRNSPWDETTSALLSKGGHLAALQWARSNGCPWDENTCTQAAAHGHLELLKWARSCGCPWDMNTVEEADIEHDHVVRWAITNGCPDWSDPDY